MLKNLLFIAFLWISAHLAAQVTADFSASPTSGCEPLVVQFNNNSTGTGLTYEWDFGNSQTSTLENPTTVYQNSGNYTVRLIITDLNNQKDTLEVSNLIQVFEPPTVDFSADLTEVCEGSDIAFTNQSTSGDGMITAYRWDFGQGGISSAENPTENYDLDGQFNVTLIVDDDNGCRGELTKTNYITVNPNPEARFNANPTTSCAAPQNVNFNNQSINNAGGNLTYFWDFGDSNTSTQASPTHQYTDNDNFDIKLIVEDNKGCKDTLLRTDYISVGGLSADFSVAQDSGCAPFTINFNNLTSTNPNISYEWRFGDGGRSLRRNPNYSFDEGGTFDVTLIADDGTCKDSITKRNFIFVEDLLKANYTLDDSLACQAPLAVSFTNQSTPSPVQQTFSWWATYPNPVSGDPVVYWSSDEENPSHAFNMSEFFDINLAVTSAFGCTDTITNPSQVIIDPPNPQVSPNPQGGCFPLENVSISDATASVVPYSNRWFVEGVFQGEDLNQFSFDFDQDTGKFEVMIAIETEDGCVDTGRRTVAVGAKPTASFEDSGPFAGCMPELKLEFNNTTNQNSPVKADSFSWWVGDLPLETDENPVIEFRDEPGMHNVMMIAMHNRCPDTIVKVNHIEAFSPLADINRRTDPCRPHIVRFRNESSGGHLFTWHFGDGNTSNEENTSHPYAEPGEWDVKLIVEDTITNCIDTAIDVAVSILGLQADFEVDSDPPLRGGCAPFQVSFDNTSYPDGEGPRDRMNYLWIFGDGNTADTENAEHTYTDPGVYDVSLIIIAPNGCRDTMTKIAYINVSEGPKPEITTSLTEACVPAEVEVSLGFESEFPVTRELFYLEQSRLEPDSLNKITLNFEEPPANQNRGYQLRYVVEDSAGCAVTVDKFLMITQPQVDIRWDTTFACDEMALNFTIALDSNLVAFPLAFDWEDSDGQRGDSAVFTKTFDNERAYDLSITVTDVNGCESTENLRDSFAFKRVKADFTADTQYASCPPLSVSFEDLSEQGLNPIERYDWFFGDGSRSVRQNPQKIYNKPGIFEVMLRITDTLGCQDSAVVPGFIEVEGPVADLDFESNTEGCEPFDLKVNASSQSLSGLRWNMRDGAVLEGLNISHTYESFGNYIPQLILEDTLGCVYAIDIDDTIFVRPTPEAAFTFEELCANAPTFFFDESNFKQTADSLNQWWVADSIFARNTAEPNFTFPNPGNYDVFRSVENEFGCADTVNSIVGIGGITSDFELASRNGCVGELVGLNNTSQVAGSLVEVRWEFGDGRFSTQVQPDLFYREKGIYSIGLFQRDSDGCEHEVFKDSIAWIGDTAPPAQPELYYVDVLNRNELAVFFEANRDFDFTEYEVFLSKNGQNFELVKTTQDMQDTAHVIDVDNALEDIYCVKVVKKNLCGFQSDFDAFNQHCQISLEVIPGTNEVSLDWSPYVGWEVEEYLIYRSTPGRGLDFRPIESVGQSQNSFIDSSILCYEDHGYKVVAVKSGTPAFRSNSDTNTVLPIYVPNIPPAVMERATVENSEYVLLEWSVQEAAKAEKFVLYRSQNGVDYEEMDSILSPTVGSYQDMDALVNEGSYFYRVKIIDSCGDVSDWSNIGRTIFLETEASERNLPQLNWNAYENWPEGVERYEIEIKNAFETFERVTDVPAAALTYEDRNTDVNALAEYCYRVKGVRNESGTDRIESVSNESCAPMQPLFWIPNAFSPNDDGLNDVFQVQAMYINRFSIKIFNRWGELVFESNDINESWDGKVGGVAQEGVFVYRIEARGVDNENHYVDGNITLLK